VRWLATFASVHAEPGARHQGQPHPGQPARRALGNGWQTESGSYRFHVGTSAEDLPLSARISILTDLTRRG